MKTDQMLSPTSASVASSSPYFHLCCLISVPNFQHCHSTSPWNGYSKCKHFIQPNSWKWTLLQPRAQCLQLIVHIVLVVYHTEEARGTALDVNISSNALEGGVHAVKPVHTKYLKIAHVRAWRLKAVQLTTSRGIPNAFYWWRPFMSNTRYVYLQSNKSFLIGY